MQAHSCIPGEIKARSGSQSRYSPWLLCATVAAASLLGSACSHLPATPAQPEPESAASRPGTGTRRYHEAIELQGRLQVQYQRDGKAQSLPGNFEWRQNGATLHIELLSALGQTLARIDQDASGASLEQSGQATRYAADLDGLLSETLGWPLPVAGLRDWLQGYTRGADGQRLAAALRDHSLAADGWQLRFASWQNDAPLPKRIDLERHTDAAGEVSLRLVIDTWKLP